MEWQGNGQSIYDRYKRLGIKLRTRDGIAPHQFDQDGWDALREEGLWELISPEGRKADNSCWWQFTAALDGLSSAIGSSGLLLSIIAQAGIVRGLDRWGSDAQREKYLEAVRTGKLSATGIAEPTTGTDVRDVHTLLTPFGNGYKLNGSKFNIAHAPVADFFLIVCKQETGAVSLVFLDRGTPGLVTGNYDLKLGNKNLPTGPIALDDVYVSPEQILGNVDRGLRQLIDIVTLGRVYYGLVASNLLRPFLTSAIEYAETRVSFGSPIIEHQHIQRRLTDIITRIERSRWTALGALGRLFSEHPQSLLDCSIAKVVGADDVISNGLELMKLYGSLGYHIGPVSSVLQDALGFASVGGTEEMHRKNIMNQILRLKKKTTND